MPAESFKIDRFGDGINLDASQRYELELDQHYSAAWGPRVGEYVWNRGPALPQTCKVLEFAPTEKTFSWVYATCGMTPSSDAASLELFLLSPCQTDSHVELLTAIAHYHQTEALLELGHTVNFGRPWLRASLCSFGLISLPYPFGPGLEHAGFMPRPARVLWLLPITADERQFKIASGLTALEELFEKRRFDYLDRTRLSVV